MTVVLGQADPLAVPSPAQLADVCSAISDVPPGAPAGFICTRAPEHPDPEHVASGTIEPAGDVTIAVWTDGSAPRVLGAAALVRLLAGGRP